MKIVVAPDSFKECLGAEDVARAMAVGVREAVSMAAGLHGAGRGEEPLEVVEMPLADGGEGTVRVLAAALEARTVLATVTGPLREPVEAEYAIVEDASGPTAILEVASACGLPLVPPEKRNPMHTTSRGVGELILDALEKGCKRILIGLGGTSTCDGGAGMLSVPGLREKAAGTSIQALYDVDCPFYGPMGAARIFGPQKGASPQEVEILDRRMQAMAEEILRETGLDLQALPGAGAAGGLGGAMAAYLGARMRSGVDGVLDLIGFDKAVKDADLILTGEGKSDAQTLQGKAPLGVLRRSKGIPVALVSGAINDREELRKAGFRHLLPVTPEGMPREKAIDPVTAIDNIRKAVAALVQRYA